MHRAQCRCGHTLTIATGATDRVVCPRCGARVRVRVRGGVEVTADGFVRFDCPCGRRLKVPSDNRPTHGKCPDCSRVVPVPNPKSHAQLPAGHPETPTAELAAADLAALERWSRDHMARASSAGIDPSTARIENLRVPETTQEDVRAVEVVAPRVEAGLRVCPQCRRPVHLQAKTCHACGAAVPKR